MTTTVPRGVVALSLVATAILVVQLTRMTVFMVDPAAVGWSIMPWNAMTMHSCMAGYWAAAAQVDHDPNVWSEDLYREPAATPGGPRATRHLGPFEIDSYEYTPTFLLLPRLLQRITPEFLAFRMLWYVLNLAIVGAAVAAIARRLAPTLGPAVLWLSSVILIPFSVIATFQIGNVQLACIAGSLLAMLGFEHARAGGRYGTLAAAGGGLLLGFMTVSKLYPAMLVVYLLLRRDWRAVAWTTGWGLALGLVGLAVLGLPTHAAFLDHLPRLLSGEAFPNLKRDTGVSASLSIPSVARKLWIYGLPFSSFDAMRVVGWIYTAVLVAIVVRLARRPVAAPLEPLAWISILLLATFRSPVLPAYGIFPGVWLLAIVLAARWTEPDVRWLLLAWYVLLLVHTPAWTLWPPTVHAIYTTIVFTGGSLAICAAALRLEDRYRDLPVSAR